MPEQQDHVCLVQAQSLQRIFRQGGEDLIALAEASCQVAPGDRIAIRGPSGSGKSTLLHLLAGLDTPSSGKVSWPARDGTGALRPAYLTIALQTPDLLPALTVGENVALPLLLNGAEPQEAHEQALEILQKLDLAGLADQLPEELSGGQAQRAVLARALVTRPRLILADEPTGQLDHPTAGSLFDRLFELLEKSDCALVIATHDRFVSDRMATQWSMQQGILTGETR